MEDQVHKVKDPQIERNDQKTQTSHLSYPSYDCKTVEMDYTLPTYHKSSYSKTESIDRETEVLLKTPCQMHSLPSSLSQTAQTLPVDPQKTLPALLGQNYLYSTYQEHLSTKGLGS